MFFPFGMSLPWLIVALVLAMLVFLAFVLKRRTGHLTDDSDSAEFITMPEAPGQVAVQDWMTEPAIDLVFDSIAAADGDIRFVGGCVRDAVLKLPVHDIDLATTLPPEAAMKVLEMAGLKVIPTGIKHGTITCLAGDRKLEITTLRRDVETDGRHATVEFTDDWKADASRRDFTMNALSMTRDGIIFDYFNGLRDLAERNVIFIGDPNMRIAEDYLRILRFFRFTGRYGRIPPAVAALAACRKAVDHLEDISGERIQSEMLRILEQTSPSVIIDLMASEKILQRLIPAHPALGMLNSLVWLETRAMGEDHVDIDPIRRLAALLYNNREAARDVAEHWRLSNAQRDRLLDLCFPDETITPDLDESGMIGAIHRLGRARFKDRLMLAWARDVEQSARKGGRNADWQRLYEATGIAVKQTFPVAGADILNAGVSPGPRVGELLAELETYWLDNACQPTREDLLKKLSTLLASAS